MQTKHSDYPWTVQSLGDHFNGYPDWTTYTVRDAHNHCLATVGQVDRATAPHNQSNAALLAAAPELLEAAELAYRNLEFSEAYAIVDKLAAAIAKAKGEA